VRPKQAGQLQWPLSSHPHWLYRHRNKNFIQKADKMFSIPDRLFIDFFNRVLGGFSLLGEGSSKTPPKGHPKKYLTTTYNRQ
jgi:hypothetical protein